MFGTRALDDEPIHVASLVTHINDFVNEIDCKGLANNINANSPHSPTVSQDPISERLSPMSKTAYVGTNARRFVTFLDEQGALNKDETQELLRQCTTMEDDLKRCKRIGWLMTQQELFFEPRLGGRHRRIAFQGNEVTGKIYEVTDIGENFVLADTCDGKGIISLLLGIQIDRLDIKLAREISFFTRQPSKDPDSPPSNQSSQVRRRTANQHP